MPVEDCVQLVGLAYVPVKLNYINCYPVQVGAPLASVAQHRQLLISDLGRWLIEAVLKVVGW